MLTTIDHTSMVVSSSIKKHPLADCQNCPLVDAKMCPTSGPADAKVAFVSRSPGKHDVRGGAPFTGPSGQVLDHLLNKHGVKREEIITTNVVLCQTDDPPLAAIKSCRPRLEAEIANVELIIAGGVEATAGLTKYRSISRARGFSVSRTSVSGKAQRVVVTNNPAAVIRDNDQYPNMVADFKRAFDPLPPPTYPEVTIVRQPSRAKNILKRWLDIGYDVLSIDLEWSGTDIACIGVANRGTKAVVFGAEAVSSTRNEWKKLFARRDVRFLFHNGISDTEILIKNGIDCRVDEDTFLMSYALDERPGFHSLEYLLSSEFGWPDYEPESVKYFKRNGKLQEPVKRSEQELYKYNGYDVAGTMQLYEKLNAKLDGDGVRELYERLLHVNARLRTVEMHGFDFDVEEACNINEREVYPLLWELTEELQTISGRFLLNPRSAPQMQAIYYQQFGLKHGLRDTGKKKLKTSTGKEVREEIRDGRFECKSQYREIIVEFAKVHMRYAKIEKLRSSFIEGLAKRVLEDGKLYCRFNIGGTATGRASSSDPNFQNIIREEIESIPGIRTLFLSSEGHVIVSADYSQAELRTCAILSGDENLLSIYRDSSRSLHRERATAFYGEKYTKEEYVKSKNINFGVTYLQSADSFAQMYHMPKDEAQAYIDSWWREFPKLKRWTSDVFKSARSTGYLQSPFGHKRRIHLITEENVRGLQREFVNFLPQNIAAWLTLSSVADLVDCGIRVLATVHDSVVADVPMDKIDDTSHIMKEIMENQAIKQLGWKDIPFLVDISTGPNWGTLTELEVAA